MPNQSTASNTTEDLLRVFTEGFESQKVLTKAVDSAIISDKFTPSTGGTVSVKRPHDYNTIETSDGDISSSTKSVIQSGKATATVQNYITVATEWGSYEESLDLDQLDDILKPMARRMITKLESNIGAYMYRNCNGAVGTVGTRIASWSDISNAQAYMESLGVPQDRDLSYVMSPYDRNKIAEAQIALAGNGDVMSAWERAQLPSRVAGLDVMSSNALATFSTGAGADKAGAINGTPTATYEAHKDTMIQSIPVDGFTNNLVVKAGEVVEVTGSSRLSLDTREAFQDNSGADVKWRGVVTADVTLSGSGAGTLAVAGPAIQEANGQYNTIETALADNDVITILNAASTRFQPNLIFHPQAFGIATVKQEKLYSTDTIVTTEEGFSIRCSKYSDGDSNKQKVRFDILPAFATFNPFFAAQAWG